MNVVWLKRDLRLRDHEPLQKAVQSGETLILYVAEPSIWLEGDLSKRHFQFVLESLCSMEKRVAERGGVMRYFLGEMEDVLEILHESYGDFTLFAHEEYGTEVTYKRDRFVQRWMAGKGLSFHEFKHAGVQRGRSSRDGFQKQWETFMNRPYIPQPRTIGQPSVIPESLLRSVDDLEGLMDRIPGEKIRYGQEGGEEHAIDSLKSFLNERYRSYRTHVSKPLASSYSCSRLSPYIAWGNLSIKTAVQQTQKAYEKLESSFEKKQMEAFISRLHWHCHFIQRLEDDPMLHEVTMNGAFDSIRQNENSEWLKRWEEGTTGIPMVDSAMRALRQTGWINFRSRAMVVSFICNTLQQDWRAPSKILARYFLDYEPGIHYSQMQMQAGTTGFNTIRIYNPVKMGVEQDPKGEFIKRFVPELKSLPAEAVHEPWLDPAFFGLRYPAPIVDIKQANRKAREQLWYVKNLAETKAEAAGLLEKHGSRKRKPVNKESKKASSEQLSLFEEEEE